MKMRKRSCNICEMPHKRSGSFSRRLAPTAFVVKSALRVATVVDQHGSPSQDVLESYWVGATDGLTAPDDLRLAEGLLIRCGLLIAVDGRLIASPELQQVLSLEQPRALAQLAVLIARLEPSTGSESGNAADWEAVVADLGVEGEDREAVLASIQSDFDDSRRSLIGEIGEEIVLVAVQAELRAMGHDNLATGARRVSLESDRFGYDVVAPRVSSAPRLLEVKSTSNRIDDTASFFISRNEYSKGMQSNDWYLVICQVESIEKREGSIVGWCMARDLQPLIPADTDRSRWQSTQINLDTSKLTFGLPSPA